MKLFLKKVFKRIQSSLESKVKYPSLESFDDPLALKIEWTPLVKGGANFVTHKLKLLSPSVVEFKASFGYKAFSLLFLIVGLLLFFWAIFNYTKSDLGDLWIFFLLIIGVGFSLSGMYLFRTATLKIIFDKDQGFFWKSRFGPREVPNKDSIKVLQRLSDIHALQIISEEVSSTEHNYESYELNLVLRSGERINLVDHGGYDQIVVDSILLGEFLSIPVWPYLKQGVDSDPKTQKYFPSPLIAPLGAYGRFQY